MSIRKIILGAATLASLAVPGLASAQRYDGYYGNDYRYSGYDRRYDDRRYDDRRRWEERRRWQEIQRRREWERRHRHDWRGHYDDRYYRY